MVFTKPIYILFAGVNGSEKSTLYRLHLEYQNLSRINTDEIVRGYGDWKDISNQIKAGCEAVELLKSYFADNISFNQETTLCGRSIIKNIENAKKLGYQILQHLVFFIFCFSWWRNGMEKERVGEKTGEGDRGRPEKPHKV